MVLDGLRRPAIVRVPLTSCVSLKRMREVSVHQINQRCVRRNDDAEVQSLNWGVTYTDDPSRWRAVIHSWGLFKLPRGQTCRPTPRTS